MEPLLNQDDKQMLPVKVEAPEEMNHVVVLDVPDSSYKKEEIQEVVISEEEKQLCVKEESSAANVPVSTTSINNDEEMLPVKVEAPEEANHGGVLQVAESSYKKEEMEEVVISEEEKQFCAMEESSAANVPVSTTSINMESCKTRWESLHHTFVRYQNKKKSIPTRSGRTSHNEGKYSNIMSFLLPYTQPWSNKTSFETQDDWDASATQTVAEPEEVLCAATCGPSVRQSCAASTEPSTPQQPKSQGKRTRLKPNATTSVGEKLLSMLDEPVPKEPKLMDTDFEEAYHFAMSVVYVLYRMDRTNRIDAKLALLSTLREFEDKAQQYIPQPPGPCTPVKHLQPPFHSQCVSSIQSPNPPPAASTFTHMLDPNMSQQWYQ